MKDAAGDSNVGDKTEEESVEGDNEDDDDEVDQAVIKRVRRISEGDEPCPFRKRKNSRGRRNSRKLTEEEERMASKIHHLFVKVPPKRTAKFERMVRRNRTLEHEVKVYSELLRDLQDFVKSRVGDAIQLKIPRLYHGGGEDDKQVSENVTFQVN